MQEHIPYMLLTAIPAFALGWFTGASYVRRAFMRYLRRRHGRYAA
jgi:hypothetical protein